MPEAEGQPNWFVRPVDFLAELDDKAFGSLCKRADRSLLKAGEVLFKQDDPADHLYIVVTGTLGVYHHPSDADVRRLTALVGKGEVIGEVGIVGGGSRSADVIALRDTDLLRISSSDFEKLVDDHPEIAKTVARILAGRFKGITQTPFIKIRPKVISFIAASNAVDVEEIANRIADILKRHGGSRIHIQGVKYGGLDAGELNRLEDHNDLVILCVHPGDETWMNRCTRQSDRICLIMDSSQPVFPQVQGQFLGRAHDHQMIDLYLVHETGDVCPRLTDEILDGISVNRFFHIRSDHRGDWERWGRTLMGLGVGVVFSGGGARAYAHLGVYKALVEAGVTIDFVAGTSMGAIVAAGIAMDWSPEELEGRVHESFVASNPLSDYTLPLQSLVAGRKVERLLKRNFGSVQISDLWLPFFCVSSNLTNATSHVHNKGELWRAIRASISLPGILPPVIVPEGILVDGAAINNLPTIELSQICHGPIIGVDVSRDLALSPVQYQAHLDKPLWYRIFRPPVIGLLLRSGTVSGYAQYKQQAEAAQVNINPPLGEIDIRNWKMFDKTVELGYRHTMDMLEQNDTLSSLARIRHS